MPWDTRCRIRRVTVAALVSLWAGIGSALAIQPLDQSRSVDGFVIVPQCGGDAFDHEEAEGFEPFVGRAVAILACDLGSGRAVAEQRSRITQANLVARGRAVSRADAAVEDIIHAIADTPYSVTFEVETETPYTLRGRITAAASDENIVVLAAASVRLVGPLGELLADFAVEPGPGGELETVVFDEGGVLQPGQHTLTAAASTVIDNEVPPGRSAEASFQLVLQTFSAAP